MTKQEPANHTHAETLDAKTHPCPCVEHHEPGVHRTQGHHVLPQYAGGQALHPDKPGYTKIQPLCPTGHDAVHMLLDEWATEEAHFVKTGGALALYTPPLTGRNHIHNTVAMQGWAAYKKYWPDKLFPRLHSPTPSPSPAT